MLISVIIPVFNGERFIATAIKSALQQEEVYEVIVVNDGSTDQTEEICNAIIKSNNKVKYFRLPINKGPSAARNIGLEKSKGRYISFLDADDYFLPKRFKKSIKVLETSPMIDGVYSIVKNQGFEKYDKNQPQAKILGIKDSIQPEDLFSYVVKDTHDFFSIISLVFRREVLNRIDWFDESLKYSEDIDFIYSLSSQYKLVSDQEQIPKIVRIVHDQNLTINPEINPATMRFPIVDKWYQKMINDGFNLSSNWSLMRRFLHVNYYRKDVHLGKLARIGLKLFIFLGEVITHPVLIYRLTFGK